MVIVGTNGSGKSTIIKLLSRFYEPTSGSILIDGIPIEEYIMAELRQGVAMLTQEHQLFPLSVEENITLGSSEVEAIHDQQKIGEAVSAAGAESIVENFSDGYGTVLEPATVGYISYTGQGNKELETMRKDLQKPSSISGELAPREFHADLFSLYSPRAILQEARNKSSLRMSDCEYFLVSRRYLIDITTFSARTFMRLFTSPIKLVAVDEPSSALDPDAEYRLFANLRRERKGRTMIFVTHRFGHLTKHADLIMYVFLPTSKSAMG